MSVDHVETTPPPPAEPETAIATTAPPQAGVLFSVTDEVLKSLKEDSEFRVTDIHSKEQLKELQARKMRIVRARTSVDRTRKTMNDPYQQIIKENNAKGKKLADALAPLEAAIEKEQARVEKAIEDERVAAANKIFAARMKRLEDIGQTMPEASVRGMSDESFEDAFVIALAQAAERKRLDDQRLAQEAEAKRLQAEQNKKDQEERDRLKREQDDADRRRQEEQAQLDRDRAELDRKQREFEEQQAELRRQNEEQQAELRRKNEELERRLQEVAAASAPTPNNDEIVAFNGEDPVAMHDIFDPVPVELTPDVAQKTGEIVDFLSKDPVPPEAAEGIQAAMEVFDAKPSLSQAFMEAADIEAEHSITAGDEKTLCSPRSITSVWPALGVRTIEDKLQDDAVEAYIRSLPFSAESDYEFTLVAGNIRGFVAYLKS